MRIIQVSAACLSGITIHFLDTMRQSDHTLKHEGRPLTGLPSARPSFPKARMITSMCSQGFKPLYTSHHRVDGFYRFPPVCYEYYTGLSRLLSGMTIHFPRHTAAVSSHSQARGLASTGLPSALPGFPKARMITSTPRSRF
jgi:hypothetical protein